MTQFRIVSTKSYTYEHPVRIKPQHGREINIPRQTKSYKLVKRHEQTYLRDFYKQEQFDSLSIYK